ncbi:HD domain-containing protein [Cellulomonas sp. P4]|uniref:HD domain-containing protein n=1 Tax=Cellulomonas sp. P4 TaxID=3142533 RepID=UPI0031BB9339
MGVYDAPQWLLSAFVRSAQGAGATAPPDEIREVGADLVGRWTGPGRTYHNLRHLTDVLARVDELAEETHEPDLVRLAAWYHGAVFDAAHVAAYANRGGEDEVASGVLAREQLTGLGVPADRVERVHQLVIALVRHSADPADFDCAVLCDADLAMLAAEPQRYKAYLHDVREEYADIPMADYIRARQRIVRKLLGRPSLFVSPLGAAWEEPARQNLGAELHKLDKVLAELEGGATGQGAAAEGVAGPDAAGSAGPAGSAEATPADRHPVRPGA